MHAALVANGPARPTDWQTVNWRQAYRRVRNLRQRIFRATQAGDWKTVRSLQKLVLRSRANLLVSVRRVTQLNQGKNTAGVDKLVVKTPATRGRLVDQLATGQPWRAKPRPAGIHTEGERSPASSRDPHYLGSLPPGPSQERTRTGMGSAL